MNFEQPFISIEPTKPPYEPAKLLDGASLPSNGVNFGPAVCPICLPDAAPLDPATLIFPTPTYPAPKDSAPTYPMVPAPTYPMVPAPTYPMVPAPTYPMVPAPTYPMVPAPTYPMVPAPTYPMLPIDPKDLATKEPMFPAPTYPVTKDAMFPLSLPFPPTPQVFLEEFYNQLRFLNYFFMKHEKKYWITGGTLLGQVREKKIINWDTNNDVGVLVEDESEGESLFKAIRSFIAMTNMGKQFDIWRSTHGLKLISKQLAHAGTDIYFYQKSSDKAVLFRERSQKQWPNDYFQLSEIEKEIMQVPFGPIAVCVPNDPARYLKTVYGENVFTHARLGSFDHFTNGPRIGPKTPFPFYK